MAKKANDGYITIAAAAKRLGVTRERVLRRVVRGELRYTDTEGRIMVSESDVSGSALNGRNVPKRVAV